MALRALSLGLTALALAGCSGGGGTDCPVGQVDIDGTCCADANTDGVCDSTCTAPYVDDGAGECVCPAGTADDGAGGCCTDADSNDECDPVYSVPAAIVIGGYVGWNPAVAGEEIQSYDYAFNGEVYPDPPGAFIGLYDANNAIACAFYVNEADATATFPNETSFINYDDQGNELTDTALMGFTIDLANAEVASPTYGGQIPTCADVLNPDIWGEDPVASVQAGSGTLGIAMIADYATAAEASEDHLAALEQIEGFYEAAEWTSDWDGKILETNYYFGGFSALPFNWSHMAAGTENGEGEGSTPGQVWTVGEWESRTFVNTSDVLTTLGALETDSYLWGFADEQNVAYALLGVPQ